MTTIYVALLDEGVSCWRPVEAEHQRDDVYLITGRNLHPDDESWEFQTGDAVRCQRHISVEVGTTLRAIERATPIRDALNTGEDNHGR